ncbi:MAG: tRNA (adenosine(37)-N6)-threonylcarbamoyltransferase complex dimerization subunit type 1 TsaB [Candidatus Omnitrophota bacterium]
MRILAIDTTTRFMCIGIYDNGKIYEYSLELGHKQSSLLIPSIKRILGALKWRIEDIDYFACGLGPGSFTGIRVGLSAIKGLAWAVNKPIIGISTLDIIARNVTIASSTQIVPVIDAKRNLIYCSIYKIGSKQSELKRITPYMLLSLDELVKRIKPNSIILGDALGLYKQELLRRISRVTALDKDYWYPKPRNIIALVLEKIRLKKINTAFDLKPVYLYPKECQIRK